MTTENKIKKTNKYEKNSETDKNESINTSIESPNNQNKKTPSTQCLYNPEGVSHRSNSE